jgi:non-specific serine/threonine protein kinase
VRDDLLADLNEASDGHIPTRVPMSLDPLSQDAYDRLAERYRRGSHDEVFSAVTDPKHLRVKSYVVDVGRGIGVLHSEDDGTPKERLVGSWMPGMLRELDSRGRKNPQAFSYDGVLSQGNGLLTVVEDATQHADLLRKLLNVPDEGHVKLDRALGMDVDTQLVVISNPDLDAELDKFADRKGEDPLRALKRRLDRHEFGYLTNVSLETELLRRELTDETEVWAVDDHAELERHVREPVTVSLGDGDGGVVERELAPHALAAAAMYSVLTRLDPEDCPPGIGLVDKALLFDRGWIRDGDERVAVDEFDFDGEDGANGIPVTYTRDVVADLLVAERDRSHPELAVESVLMPDDVLDAMASGLADAPVFSRAEAAEYENRVAAATQYAFDRQEEDVLDALFAERSVDAETVEEYVEHVYAWSTDETVETDRGEVDPDPLLLKLFETEQLGRFDEADYDGNEPSPAVERFRNDRIITALNRLAWENRDEGFRVGDVDFGEVPVVRSVLDSHDWADVERLFPDLDPRQWADPPADTETARIKADVTDRLVDRGYSPASAELTSRRVMREVSHEWD